jgi:hypothetical protein
VTKPTISLDLDTAAEASGLSKRSLQYAIERGHLTAYYGGEKNTKPLVFVADLEAYVRSLPMKRGVAA